MLTSYLASGRAYCYLKCLLPSVLQFHKVSPFMCLESVQRQVDSVRYRAPSVCTVISEVRAEPLGEPGSSFHVRDHSDGLYYILNLHIRNNYVLSLLTHPSAVMDGSRA